MFNLIALLGMPHHTSAYDHVRHWTHGQWAIGPQYLVRVLVLVLWAVKPWKFAPLSDLWAVDWPGRSVEWTKRRQHEWESEGNYGTPPSPFHRLLTFAQRPNGRADTGLRAGPGCISGVSVHYRWEVVSWVSMVNLVIRHD